MIIILFLFLTSSNNAFSSIDTLIIPVEENYEFYNEEIKSFIIPPNLMNVYINSYTNSKKYYFEYNITKFKLDFQMQLNTNHVDKINYLNEVLQEEKFINDNLREQIKIKNYIINGSDNLNGTGELTMKALKYKLEKERIKNKWLSFGGAGMTTAAIVLLINLLNA